MSNDNAFEATIQDFERGDTILAIPPLFHVLGLNNCILLMLRAGGKVVLIPKYNKYKLSQLCKKYHPEMIFGVPKIGRDFLEVLDEKTDLSHLKYYVLGGEEMGKGFIEQSNAFLKQHGANIYCDQSLGATECSCSMTNTFKNSYVPGSLGIPLINLDMKVVKLAGEDIRECDYNEYGEICFSGPSVMKGYLDEINENKEYINSFDKVVIYYDNGQETLATILDTLFVSYPNVERRIDFDHKKKRLFQVLDMLTVIDKLDYKRKNNIPFTKAEKYFFNGKDFRHIINLLKNKRL